MDLDINDYDQYAALAETIKIEDITSNKQNQTILQQLKDNNEAFNELSIESCENEGRYSSHFFPQSSKELAWLGYYLGRSTTVKVLNIRFLSSCNTGREVFRRGLSRNKSIEKILLQVSDDRLEGNVFQLLHPFTKSNNCLKGIELDDCAMDVERIRQFSLALGECSKSLIHVRINAARIQSGQLVDIITAMSMHPQLEELDVSHIYPELGINDCTALATLLRHTITNLERLILDCNCMNDEGLGIIVNGLSHGSMLKDLFIVGHDQYITSNGWKSLATLLENPGCMLENIEMESNDVGDNGALAFANALTNNSTLKKLDMTECGNTEEGWTPFSKLLCDTSSVNNTYSSNHTLQCLGDERGIFNFIPTGIISHLVLNRRNRTKQQIAMIKILQNHSHFDMQPFFEWEFKVMPIMVSWFTKASACTTFLYDEKINKMKLSVVYDFIREFPMLYIEARTREEIAKCTAMEEELQGGEHKAARLEEVQCCKTRAMRRNQARLEEIRQLKARAMRRIGMK